MPIKKFYLNIAPHTPLSPTANQTYTYHYSGSKPDLYSRFTIAFGKQRLIGTLISFSNKRPSYPTKPAQLTKQPPLSQQQVKFASWLSEVNHGGLGYTLRLFTAGSSSTQDKAQHLVLVPEIKRLRAYPNYTKFTSKQALPKDLSKIAGTQKALFLPFTNLKKITVDQSYYQTHKLWDAYPRLDNRIAAQKLAEIHQADLIHTGTLPSLTDFYTSNFNSKYSLNLKAKIISATFEDRKKRFSLPDEALYHIRRSLRHKETVLLLHEDINSKLIPPLKKLFPRTKIHTVSASSPLSSSKRGAGSEVVVSTTAAFTHLNNDQADRIFWYQPEKTLKYPDYRSQERAIYLLARLQELTPRKNINLITWNPNLVSDQLCQPINKLYQNILKERKAFKYPPTTDLAKITCEKKHLKKVEDQLKSSVSRHSKVILKGPFKSLEANPKKPTLHFLLQGQLEDLVNFYKNIDRITVDINPHRIL